MNLLCFRRRKKMNTGKNVIATNKYCFCISKYICMHCVLYLCLFFFVLRSYITKIRIKYQKKCVLYTRFYGNFTLLSSYMHLEESLEKFIGTFDLNVFQNGSRESIMDVTSASLLVNTVGFLGFFPTSQEILSV